MRRAALLVFLLALAASCSTESGRDEEARSLSTSEVRGSATTAPSTSTTEPAADCSDRISGLPEDASEVSEGLGDFDGNGATDQLIAYADRGSDPWRLQVVFAGGGSLELELDSLDRGDRVQAVGGVDLDGDKSDEALAVTGSDSSVTLVGLFRVLDCELVQARAESGDPAALFVGGSEREGVGISCEDDAIVQLKAQSSDGRRYTTTQTVLRLERGTLTVVGAEPGPFLVRGRDDEELDRYYSFHCGTLGLGPA